jgi:type II restriction enzyme
MKSVKKAQDLVTSKEAIVKGFSWQASEKVSRADTFISHADYFIKKANSIKNIADVRKDQVLTEFVIASCMLSKKSLSHLSLETQNEIIEKLIDFEKLSDHEYLRILEQRYFLTSGDSLGGTMRNVIGQFAQEKLTEAIIARLQKLNKNPERVVNKDNKTTAIKWLDRQVIFDKKPTFINKSIDIIVVKGESARTGKLENPRDYVCCGELKGGIDPAGADEHWKTAKTALERIVTAFVSKKLDTPNLVFIGAAIENSMSNEIFDLLESQWLTGAANINYADQFNEVIDIIIS